MLFHTWKVGFTLATFAILMVAIAGTPAFAGKEIQWEKAFEKGLAEAKKTGKPMMLDFYTEW